MNPHQPRLDAWTEVLSSSLAEGGIQAARDFHPGDTIIDLLVGDNAEAVELEDPSPYSTLRHQPRQVAQHIPAGTELVIGEDGRVYGLGLEPPADPVTFAGVPVQTDEEIQVGTVHFRSAEGRTLAQLNLANLLEDEAQAAYAEKIVRQGGAQPFVNPFDAEPGAPMRYLGSPEAEAGVMGHQVTHEALDESEPFTDDQVALIERIFASAVGEIDKLERRRGRVRSIYVASSWRNPHQPHVVEEIRAATAAEVYDFRNPPGGTGFAWSSIDPDWQAWTAEEYLAALEHPLAEAGFRSDFDAMRAADTFVLVLPCGRSAHLELGWAVGAGKRTVILTQDGEEPELMAKMVDHIATSVDDVVEWLVDQDAEAHHEDVDRADRLARLWAELDEIPIPFVTTDSQDAVIEAQPIVDYVTGLHALEEVAVAAAVDVDVAVVEQLRDAAGIIRDPDTEGPEVIRNAIATGLEHAARTLEAGNPVDDLDDVLEIAAALVTAARQACRVCGCTNDQSCDIPGRCAWEEPDLCTNPACIAQADQS